MIAWIARYAPQCMAAGVVLGLAVPPLAAALRPLLVPTLLIPLTLALLRLDWSGLRAYRHRPRLMLLLLTWLLVVCPLLVAGASRLLVAAGLPPPLHQAVVLMAASSPIVSSVAIALMVGLDATLALAGVLVATALVPFTLPVLAAALLGVALDIALPEFIARLFGLVGAAFAAAWLLRRFVPMATQPRAIPWLDAVTVGSLVIFAIAIMDGVTAFARANASFAVLAVVLAFGVNLVLQAAGYLAFARLGRRAALTAGFLSGNCNMGIILVALQGRAAFEVTVFFAIAQLPMYMLPALLQPLYRRVMATRPA